MTLAAGKQLGPYEILSPLGKGGMGEVYLARDIRLKRKVALKLLPAAFTQDEDRVRRFEQEAQAASALNHPNIITIYEIGEVDGTHFIATEFIEGQTLRQQMTSTQMKLAVALDLATQVASALAAAHAAGIVHRDIKPENVMVRPDGLVKVLDFGLAKLTEVSSSSVDTGAPTSARVKTETGAVMGTPRYMSPEQARGQKADARTDIFSLGVVLFEMIAGRGPFEGATAGEVIGAILHLEPPPLQHYVREMPEALEWIITKALQKDREQRYQGVKDLALDLKGLKHRLEIEAEREHSGQPSVREEAASDRPASEATMQAAAAQTDERAAAGTTSSAKILLGEIKRHRLGVALTLAALVIAAMAAFFYFNRGFNSNRPILTDKDTILLADFVNNTGEPVFDGGTLKQGLAVQLQQSPFLNLFPDERVRQALRLMNKPPDERVTREVGREIAQRQRQGLKAVITGTIAKFDRNYSVTLEAINSQTGEQIALTQAEAEGKDQVLRALSQAATQLREKLGESLGSIQRFDKPLEEATTSKLEAFQAHALGTELAISGRLMESIPVYKRAVEMDPDFATAYSMLSIMHIATGRPSLAAKYAEKAYALKDRVGEFEKLRITSFYHGLVTGDLNKRIEVLRLQKQIYPRVPSGSTDLGLAYNQIGQFDQAIVEAREALRLNPNFAAPYRGLGLALLRLNRFAEAKDALTQALQQKLEMTDFHSFLYQIAFVGGDTAGMQQQIEWARGKPDEYVAFDWQTGAAAFAGQWRRAQELARRAIDLASRGDTKEVAARYEAEQALRAAVFGQFTLAKAAAANSLALERNQVTLTRVALALALSGEPSQAQMLVDELVKRYPQDTLINGIWLPAIRAALELQRGNAGQAREQLQPTLRYEEVAEFWPKYLRGQAYLKLGQGAEAAVEFQKILGSRGWEMFSPLYPLAHLGLARAAALGGDAAKSRKAYQDFLALWKDADADLPILIEAKKEYEKVK
jgi:serine/threonine protein kinase/Flp pilus assembly protein TadD